MALSVKPRHSGESGLKSQATSQEFRSQVFRESGLSSQVESLKSCISNECLGVLLILVDMTHTSKGFEAKPDAVSEAHSPGPGREHKQICFAHT